MSLKKENDEVEKMDQRFDCRMSTEEKNEIKRLASLHNMKVSEYVRHKALSYQSEPLVDSEKVELLMEKNAELTRLGNLLKIWLFDDPKYSIQIREKIELKLAEILDKIDKNRVEMEEIVDIISDNFKQGI